MWRVRRGRRCGVLNDFDLSSRRDRKGPSSNQRTGTRPYMAHELHVDNSEPTPLYRHDLESLFYVLLILTCAYDIIEKPQQGSSALTVGEDLRFYKWISMTDSQLLLEKYALLYAKGVEPPETTKSFMYLQPWVAGLRSLLGHGFSASGQADRDQASVMSSEKLAPWVRKSEAPAPKPVPFDTETLNGNVTYAKFFSIMGSGLDQLYPVASSLL